LTDEQKEVALIKKQLKDISEEHEILKKWRTSSPRATSEI